MKTSTKNSRTHELYMAHWNKQVTERRQALIVKIKALQPAIQEDKLNFLAVEHGNIALEEVLVACQKIASLI